MVPEISRSEWAALITEGVSPKITSLSLQLKINSLRLDYKLQKVNLKDAIADLHKFCQAKENMHQKDLDFIFKLNK